MGFLDFGSHYSGLTSRPLPFASFVVFFFFVPCCCSAAPTQLTFFYFVRSQAPLRSSGLPFCSLSLSYGSNFATAWPLPPIAPSRLLHLRHAWDGAGSQLHLAITLVLALPPLSRLSSFGAFALRLRYGAPTSLAALRLCVFACGAPLVQLLWITTIASLRGLDNNFDETHVAFD